MASAVTGLRGTFDTLLTTTGKQLNEVKVSDGVCEDGETLEFKAIKFLAECERLKVRAMMVMVGGEVMGVEIVSHLNRDVADFLHTVAEAVETEGTTVNMVVEQRVGGMN